MLPVWRMSLTPTQSINSSYRHGWTVRASSRVLHPSLKLNLWNIPLTATRKSTLVFCVNLAHVRELTNTFREFGIDARYVYSGTPVAERKALISSFKEGAFPVLVNCGE